MGRFKKIQVKISPQLDGQRIDQALATMQLELSKRKIRKVIDIGGVYLNRRRIMVASRKVKTGDFLQVEYNEEFLKAKIQKISLTDEDILYEDKDVVVINKPPGLASQGTRDQNILHVISALQNYYKEKKENQKLIAVHRLDKETSGVMVLAKNEFSAKFIQDQFRDKSIDKTYVALCFGKPKKSDFNVKNHLSFIDPKTGNVTIVRSGGRLAITNFSQLNYDPKNNISLMQCHPQTGRSHQIRVHLADEALPIIGDKRYGREVGEQWPEGLVSLVGEHHFLHAQIIKFQLPKGKVIEVRADFPPRFKKFLSYLGFSAIDPTFK